jgi:hypothetical protein
VSEPGRHCTAEALESVTPSVLSIWRRVFQSFHRSNREDAEPQAIPRDDGSWLLAGSMSADEMADLLGITLPAKREYHTVASFATCPRLAKQQRFRAGGLRW